MRETGVQSLGREDLLEKQMVTHSSIFPENPMDGGVWWVIVHGVAKSRTRLNDFTFSFLMLPRQRSLVGYGRILAVRFGWVLPLSGALLEEALPPPETRQRGGGSRLSWGRRPAERDAKPGYRL